MQGDFGFAFGGVFGFWDTDVYPIAVHKLPRTDPRRHAWLEAGDAAQIAGRWLASHPSERLGLVCSCGVFSEMLVPAVRPEPPMSSIRDEAEGRP